MNALTLDPALSGDELSNVAQLPDEWCGYDAQYILREMRQPDEPAKRCVIVYRLCLDGRWRRAMTFAVAAFVQGDFRLWRDARLQEGKRLLVVPHGKDPYLCSAVPGAGGLRHG